MRYLTAGESHGPELTAIIEGLPAGMPLLKEDIDKELKRRQQGYGRGGRMKIEKDQARITAGIRHGRTMGSPVSLAVENKDWKHWETVMSIEPIDEKSGHASCIKTPSRTCRFGWWHEIWTPRFTKCIRAIKR